MRAGRPGALTRERLRRIPTAGWICSLVALLTATAWSLIIPLFQAPDEPAHVAYAQYLAETGSPPTGDNDKRPFSQQERQLLNAVQWKAVIHRPQNEPPATATAHQLFDRLSDHQGDPVGAGGFTSATNNPPLYYAAEAAVYHLTPSSSLPDRIHAMRLLSALLAAVTVLFVFLFLREVVPGTPWAWTVGALAVAFQPMFGFVSGGVNSDNLLFAASAGSLLGPSSIIPAGAHGRAGRLDRRPRRRRFDREDQHARRAARHRYRAARACRASLCRRSAARRSAERSLPRASSRRSPSSTWRSTRSSGTAGSSSAAAAGIRSAQPSERWEGSTPRTRRPARSATHSATAGSSICRACHSCSRSSSNFR